MTSPSVGTIFDPWWHHGDGCRTCQASRVVFALRGNRRFGTRSWRDLEDPWEEPWERSRNVFPLEMFGNMMVLKGKRWWFFERWWNVKDDDSDGKTWESTRIGDRTVGPVSDKPRRDFEHWKWRFHQQRLDLSRNQGITWLFGCGPKLKAHWDRQIWKFL